MIQSFKKYKVYVLLVVVAQLLVVNSVAQSADGSEFSYLLQNQDHTRYIGFESSIINPNNLSQFLLNSYAASNNSDSYLSQLKSENKLGKFLQNNLIINPGWKAGERLTLGVNFRQQIYQFGVFDDDFVLLFAKGNQQFAGNSITFSPVKYQLLASEAIGVFGEFGEQIKFRIGAEFVNINSFVNLNGGGSSLFTSEFGDSLHAGLKVNYKGSNRSGIFSSTGYGFTLNFSTRIYDFHGCNLGLSVSELGLSFLKDLSAFEIDTTINFNGIDLLDNEANSTSLAQFDSIFDPVTTHNEKFFFAPLIQLSLFKEDLFNQTDLWVNARYRMDAYHYPALQVALERELWNWKNAQIKVNLGVLSDGYGRQGITFGTGWVSEPLSVHLSLRHLENPVRPGLSGYGVSALAVWSLN